MSSTVTTTPSTGSRMVADSLAWGLIAMLISNILQRGVGLARGIGFCHFLSDQQLGMWSLAQTFFLIAAPLAVLGMPGSFARFVEYYQRRGELLRYIQGVVLVSSVGVAILALAMLVWPEVSTSLIFGASQSWSTLLVLVLSLACVILLNTLSELAIGLFRVDCVHTRLAMARHCLRYIQPAGLLASPHAAI
jgi:polysaccharide transporter, PST family